MCRCGYQKFQCGHESGLYVLQLCDTASRSPDPGFDGFICEDREVDQRVEVNSDCLSCQEVAGQQQRDNEQGGDAEDYSEDDSGDDNEDDAENSEHIRAERSDRDSHGNRRTGCDPPAAATFYYPGRPLVSDLPAQQSSDFPPGAESSECIEAVRQSSKEAYEQRTRDLERRQIELIKQLSLNEAVRAATKEQEEFEKALQASREETRHAETEYHTEQEALQASAEEYRREIEHQRREEALTIQASVAAFHQETERRKEKQREPGPTCLKIVDHFLGCGHSIPRELYLEDHEGPTHTEASHNYSCEDCAAEIYRRIDPATLVTPAPSHTPAGPSTWYSESSSQGHHSGADAREHSNERIGERPPAPEDGAAQTPGVSGSQVPPQVSPQQMHSPQSPCPGRGRRPKPQQSFARAPRREVSPIATIRTAGRQAPHEEAARQTRFREHLEKLRTSEKGNDSDAPLAEDASASADGAERVTEY